MPNSNPEDTRPGLLKALLMTFRVFAAIGHRGPNLAEQGIRPHQLILAGILAAALLVLALLVIVQIVLHLAR